MKTLKDFSEGKGDWYKYYVKVKELRAEAVKHFKFWDNMKPEQRRMPKSYIQGRKQALVDFFNLTKEDLK